MREDIKGEPAVIIPLNGEFSSAELARAEPLALVAVSYVIVNWPG